MENQTSTALTGDSYRITAAMRDVAWRRRSWSIAGAGGPFEARRVGRRPSGLRHRLPVEIVGPKGALATVVRSRGLKSSARRFVVVDPSDRVVGALDVGQRFFGLPDPWLVNAAGERLGRLDLDARAYVDAVDELSGVNVTVKRGAGEMRLWKTDAEMMTWKIDGIGTLPTDLGLLALAHVLVIEPWRWGEEAAVQRSMRESRYSS